MLLTSVYDQSKIQRKETGLLPYGYCLGGVLVSFFICKIQLLTKNLHATINLQMFIIRNEARVHVFFITVNLNDYNSVVKSPGKCRILTKKCQIVPMKCRILQEKYRIVPIKCQILQIRWHGHRQNNAILLQFVEDSRLQTNLMFGVMIPTPF